MASYVYQYNLIGRKGSQLFTIIYSGMFNYITLVFDIQAINIV